MPSTNDPVSGTMISSGRKAPVNHDRWDWKSSVTTQQIVWWTLGHPLYLTETLTKMGYEPIFPSPEVYFGHTFLALPNSIRYACHVASVDGISGCFRGLLPRIGMNWLENVVQSWVEDNCPLNFQTMDEKELQRFFKELKLKLKAKRVPQFMELGFATLWKMLSVTLSTVATQPLYMITTRCIAAFVGKEGHYKSIVSCIYSIWKEDGVSGFFTGLMPRLLFHNLKVAIPVSVFFIFSRCLSQWNGLVSISTVIAKLWTQVYLHQFDVVAATMAVQNSSLSIGQAPFITKRYKDWMYCWSHLRRLNIQNRGIFPVFRYYNGPTVIANGEVQPAGVYLGPFLSPKLMKHNFHPEISSITKLTDSINRF